MGAAVAAATKPARANPTLVDTKGLGKPPPLKNTDSEFVSWARRTEHFIVSVHPGARDVLTWAVERESATVTEASAATEVLMPRDTVRMLTETVHSADDPRGGRVGSGPRQGLEAWRRSAQTMGPPHDGKSERIAQRDLFSWTCQLGRAGRAVGRLEDTMDTLHANSRCSEWPAPHANRGHQNGGVGGTSS